MTSECLWQEYAALFRRLYLDENKTLKEVKLEAEGAYGFPISSLSAYEIKLRDLLGLRKNLSPEGWVAIGQKIRARNNPKWKVYFNGRSMPRGKVMKEIRRYTKQRSYSANLTLPPGAEIKWLDESHPMATVSAGGRSLQQIVTAIPFKLNLDIPRIESLSIDSQSMFSPKSPSDVLQGAEFLIYNVPGIINQTLDIAVAANKAISPDFSAAILDPLLKELWKPILDDSPFTTLSRTLSHFFSAKTPLSHTMSKLPTSQNPQTQDLETCSLMSSSIESDQCEVSGRFHMSSDMDAPDMLPHPSTISSNFDPFRILVLLVYYLSNHFKGLHQTRDTILFLMEQVPQSLVGKFLDSDSPSIRASWMPLAEWSFELHEKNFFEQVMQVALRCHEWFELHGARCLTFAANFGCTTIVRSIIARDVSPNEFSEIGAFARNDNSTPGFSSLAAVQVSRSQPLYRRDTTVKTFPLLEAAARGNLEVLEILKDSKVDCRLRSSGFTAAGHAMLAYERGAIDEDALLSTLSLLLTMGEEIDAPLWEGDPATLIYDNESYQVDFLWSAESLLDAIYINFGDDFSFEGLRARSQLPDGVLTVSGILRSAMDGCDALDHYMASARYPVGLSRKRIEEVAIVRSFQKPEAFDSMMSCGFKLEITTLQGRDNNGVSHDELPNAYDSDIYFFLSSRLEDFPDSVSDYIFDWFTQDKIIDHIDFISELSFESLIPKLEPDQARSIFLDLLQKSCEGYDFDAIELCREAGMSFKEFDLMEIMGHQWARTSILDELYDLGARFSPPPQDLRSTMLLTRHGISKLKWMITHGLDLKEISVYDIIARCHGKADERQEIRDLGEWLSTQGYPLYTPPPPNLHSEQCDTSQNGPSLSLLVCLGCSIDLVLQLSDQGANINPYQPSIESLFKEMDSTGTSKLFDWSCEPPLIAAIWNRNVPMIQALLDCGADINAYNHFGSTVLDSAVEAYVEATSTNEKVAWKQLIMTLLERGADACNECHCIYNRTASPSLVHAVEKPNPDIQLIKLLLEKGASLRWDKQSLLRTILSSEWIDLELEKGLFELLLASGARYNSSEELVSACIGENIKLVRFHLENGANPNIRVEAQSSQRNLRTVRALEEIAKLGNMPIALILLAAGATLSGDDRSLSLAAENGRLDMIALLLPQEKRRDQVDEALECALRHCHCSIIRLLRQHLATVNQEE